MKIYNSLSRKLEDFKPINPKVVTLYSCGPTVYHYLTIGNFRTYTISDFLVRTLKFNNFKVKYIMNITDVGHLTGDNEGDADTGQDRLEKGARREGKTAWEIADFYIHEFLHDYQQLNLTPPQVFPRATEHIPEQIDLIKRLEDNHLTYKTSDGIYFDTKTYEQKLNKIYGQLSDLDQIKEGARVQINPEKKNPRDFALWKFSPKNEKRHMEWESPWGLGFPGWHIECSAMSMKYLGETFDIHLGGEDLKQTHHPNEIAQSEGATEHTFVNYWTHVRYLKVDNQKMGKSLGNAYILKDIIKKQINPLALRYFYMTTHYRDQQNFTWEALENSHNSLLNLYEIVAELKNEDKLERNQLSEDKLAKIKSYDQKFKDALNNDLNIPQALAVAWEVAKSNIPSMDKLDLLMLFDEVLGLSFVDIESKVIKKTQQYTLPSGSIINSNINLTEKILTKFNDRELARKSQDFVKSDKLRQELENSLNIKISDSANLIKVESNT